MVGTVEGMRAYLAEIDGVPVASGGMAMQDGALPAAAATLPKWRNRGALRALVEHRLACAAGAGRTWR